MFQSLFDLKWHVMTTFTANSQGTDRKTLQKHGRRKAEKWGWVGEVKGIVVDCLHMILSSAADICGR